MSKSYRIRTKLGTDQNIRVNVEQDFDFLEILSLKLRQEDVYSRFCADYGVVVGRVVANSGFGIPNARVSIFIPVDDMDLEDPVISTYIHTRVQLIKTRTDIVIIYYHTRNNTMVILRQVLSLRGLM